MVKKQLALQASAFSNPQNWPASLFSALYHCQANHWRYGAAYMASLILLKNAALPMKIWQNLKAVWNRRFINGLQSVSGKVSQLAEFQTFTGNPNKTDDLLKIYNAAYQRRCDARYNTYIKSKGAVVVSVLTKRPGQTPAKADNYTIDYYPLYCT